MSIQLDAEAPPLASDPDGVIRVGGTRVTLDTVVDAYQHGATAYAISEQYSSLSAADIYAAIGFYLRHRAEVDAYLIERRTTADEVRISNERRHDPTGVRARLVARKQAT